MILRLPALLLAAMLLWSQPAAALDLKMVAGRFLSHLGQLGVRMRWKSIEVVDGEVWIKDVWILDGEDEWLAETVHLREFYERTDHYLIGALHAPSVMVARDGQWAHFEGVQAYGVRVPTDDAPLPAGSLLDFDEVAFDGFEMATGGREIGRFGKGHLHAEIADDGSEVSYSGAIESLYAYGRNIENPTAREAMLAMGYENIKGYLEYEWTLQGSPASMTVDYLGLSLVDAGTVSMTGEFVPAGAAKIPFAGIHRAGVLLDPQNGFAIRSATLRFDDDGIGGKLLDYAAAQQGMGMGAAVLQLQTLAALQIGMSLGIGYVPHFMGALNAFLASPESLELKAEPAEPVALNALSGMEAGAAAGRLSLTITANN